MGRAKLGVSSVEARNLSWYILLGDLRVGAIDHSNMAITGPLRSIFRIARGQLAYTVERPIFWWEPKGFASKSNSECVCCVYPGVGVYWVS